MNDSRSSGADSYWATESDALAAGLGTSDRGLPAMEAEARLRSHGPNRLNATHRGPVWEAIVSQLRNPLLWLLTVAAIIGFSVGETTESVLVLAILGLGSTISVVQETKAGRALERLTQRIALQARVIRDGEEVAVPSITIVPGDVLVLSAGTLISADAVVLEANELYVSEGPLTGEPFAVEKHPGVVEATTPLSARFNVVHMGTNVRSGTGRAVVVATGARTEFGRVARRLSLRPPETEFQRGLRRFGYLLLSLMVVLVFVVFAATALRHHPPVAALLFAVALAVGLAPEMLPAVLATMLARGARTMARRGVLVRRLEAIENLGNMDVLCTDKTGTLTEGEIQLASCTDAHGNPAARVLQLAHWNARLQAGLPNPLDAAIVAAGPPTPGELPAKLGEVPFDFVRKRLSVLVRRGEDEPLLVTKGAAAAVLGVCSSVRTADGRLAPLEAQTRRSIEDRVEAWSRDGMRVIAIATKPWPSDAPLDRTGERALVLEGFATFRDPPKAGVTEALAGLRDLGVRVKIIRPNCSCCWSCARAGGFGTVGPVGRWSGRPQSSPSWRSRCRCLRRGPPSTSSNCRRPCGWAWSRSRSATCSPSSCSSHMYWRGSNGLRSHAIAPVARDQLTMSGRAKDSRRRAGRRSARAIHRLRPGRRRGGPILVHTALD